MFDDIDYDKIIEDMEEVIQSCEDIQKMLSEIDLSDTPKGRVINPRRACEIMRLYNELNSYFKIRGSRVKVNCEFGSEFSRTSGTITLSSRDIIFENYVAIKNIAALSDCVEIFSTIKGVVNISFTFFNVLKDIDIPGGKKLE